jgi:outer membrane protein assembly factor BamB
LVFDSARNVVFATLQDTAEVVALDPSDLNVVARYKLAASQPTAMILDPAVHRLYVAVRHAVVTLDAESGTEVGRVAAPPGVDSLWLDQAAGVLYVASGGGYINVYRTRGGLTPVQEIRTEVRGHTVAFDPSRSVVYVPGGREGRSKLLILRQLPMSDPEDRGEQVANK